MAAAKESLHDTVVDYNASASKSCQSKYGVAPVHVQPYLDDLQDRFGLHRISFCDLGDTGGSFSVDVDVITKWWFRFWEKQPDFWFNHCKQGNGKSYAPQTLKRYMGSLKNLLVKKFSTSCYLPVIIETYKSSEKTMNTLVNKKEKQLPPKRGKAYSTDDIAFILERCLWLNSKKFIDFFVWQTATLRLSSRAAETSRISVRSLSVCELNGNSILQCYLHRDKYGTAGDTPIIPNKEGLFGDLTVAIGIALFFYDDKLMPSINLKEEQSSAYYSSSLDTLWNLYPPAAGIKVKKGTSHFGKHTAQWQLDSNKLHIAADLFGGWKVGKGARTAYSYPFPYLLEGAKALAGWPKVGGEYQEVAIPSYDGISKILGDKICSAFYGHIPDSALSRQAKGLILMCVLSKWNDLTEHIRSEPNGLYKNPSNHILFFTLESRLSDVGVELNEFEKFKSACANLFVNANSVNPVAAYNPIHRVIPIPRVSPIPSVQAIIPNPDSYVHRLASLLCLVTRSTSTAQVLVTFFSCGFIDAFDSAPNVPKRMSSRYRKIKAAIRVLVRFLDSYPADNFGLEDAKIAVNRIKGILLSVAPSSVKHQGLNPFSVCTPVCLSIIRSNEALLIDKTKEWYRILPRDTPVEFIEHVYRGCRGSNRIYNVE